MPYKDCLKRPYKKSTASLLFYASFWLCDIQYYRRQWCMCQKVVNNNVQFGFSATLSRQDVSSSGGCYNMTLARFSLQFGIYPKIAWKLETAVSVSRIEQVGTLWIVRLTTEFRIHICSQCKVVFPVTTHLLHLKHPLCVCNGALCVWTSFLNS